MLIVVSVSTSNIEIHGHAGYAEQGKDIVCSAVTALTFNLIHSIEVLTKDIIVYQADKEGHVNIEMKRVSDKGMLLIDSFLIGISDIVNTYPNYVQVINAVAERA